MRTAPLFGRTPLGMGTSRVESLSGFFVRAATARNLSTSDAIQHLLLPRLEHIEDLRSLASIGFYDQHVRVLDGLAEPSSVVSSIVGDLTGVGNLEQNTLIPWSRFMNPKMSSVLRPTGKRWCAQCFREWRETGEELREPLAWRIALMKRCTVHGMELSERCPKCGNRQPILTNIVPIGYCGRCGASLDCGDPNLNSDSVDHGEVVSQAIGRLLAANGEISRTGGLQGFVRLLNEAVACTSTGSDIELSRHLGIGVPTLRDWCAGRRRPRFSYFMGVCLRLGVDPATVVVASNETPLEPAISPERTISLAWRRERVLRTKRRGPYSQSLLDEARCQLEQAIAAGGRRSVAAIGRAVGVHWNSLRYRFPELATELIRLHRERTIRVRDLRRERTKERIRRAVRALVEAGEYPSLNRTLEVCGLRRQLRRKLEIATVWREERDRRWGYPQ